mmetsp:Transcript_40429/g.61671  ORF Transcript_40429/g.61671 Transcript_40429/m.61671 type:complete len:93 (+) Transcript_40429:475-753(+)
MTLITIYALFFDDLRVLKFNKEHDDIFFGITLIGIISYTVEIALSVYGKPGYYKSFFFWLDLCSTLSMIPDCEWVLLLFSAGSIDSGSMNAT